jgi:hypothetical protein
VSRRRIGSRDRVDQRVNDTNEIVERSTLLLTSSRPVDRVVNLNRTP